MKRDSLLKINRCPHVILYTTEPVIYPKQPLDHGIIMHWSHVTLSMYLGKVNKGKTVAFTFDNRVNLWNLTVVSVLSLCNIPNLPSAPCERGCGNLTSWPASHIWTPEFHICEKRNHWGAANLNPPPDLSVWRNNTLEARPTMLRGLGGGGGCFNATITIIIILFTWDNVAIKSCGI